MSLQATAPSWVKKGAIVDFDFANNRLFGAPIDRRRLPRMQSSMAPNGYGTDNVMTGVRPDGKVELFLGFALRISSGRGLWSESGDTQYALQMRDLSNAAWTKTNCTATRNQAGADTASTASRGTLLTATAGNATCLQAITLASGAFTVGAWVRRSVGTGRIDMTMDGGTTWVEITSQITSTYTRIQIPSQTVTNPNVGFRIVTSGDAIIVDFFQAVNRSFLPTPIITTTATITRTSERPAINHEGSASSFNQGENLIRRLFLNGAVGVFVEYAGFGFDGTGSAVNVSGATGLTRLSGGVMGATASFGEALTGSDAVTSNTGNSSTAANYVFNRAAATISGGGCKVSLNGGDIATGTSTPNFISAPATAYDHYVLGGNGDGTATLNGCFRRVAYWHRELTDAELMGLSSWSSAETTIG